MYYLTSRFICSGIKNSKPNFITEDIVKGKLKKIDKTSKTSVNLNNRIIVIDSADPGFDWIFTNKIRGLMTKYSLWDHTWQLDVRS